MARCLVLLMFALAGAGLAQAQTVQLPTYHSFYSTGSVLVPDRGGAFLGGVTRNATGSVRRGLPGLGAVPSGIGQSASRVGASVHVTIIDLQAMDRQILSQSPRGNTYVPSRRAGSGPSSLGQALELHSRRPYP